MTFGIYFTNIIQTDKTKNMDKKAKQYLEKTELSIKKALKKLDERDIYKAKKNLKKSLEELQAYKRYYKFIDSPENLPETVEELKEKYEEVYNSFFNLHDIDLWSNQTGSRLKESVYLRDFFCKMAFNHYCISQHAIGRLVNRDRSNIYHSLNKEVVGCPEWENVKKVLIQNNLYY